ncbi:MAG TPA: nicotinate phosphoribosyltransferase [Gammaproteobacteria bacterium]|nr:nicotinate phosphoribosyltransferase [Gammaproteobacteria bacterium]
MSLQSEGDQALFTDLYQLTMLQGYFLQGMEETAVFEFFVRRLPAGRRFLMAAGLEQALDYLEGLRFTEEELEWLRHCGRFREDFIDYLAELRFRGEVRAMPEGTVFFPDEPIVQVIAPLPQAQLVESRLINILHFQTLIASKAARVVLAGQQRLLVDFGMRRAHGAEAGLMAARASYIAGFAGTATTLAAPRFGIPVYGTMAHSFVQSHDDEIQAFEHFAQAQPDNAVLLIDTYDTERGARRVVELAPRLRERGIEVKAVRLDSGDLAAHARAVRKILDEGGLAETRIFASGNLDENRIRELLESGAPIDGFGVGTILDTSADAPYLDCAYKLQEYAGRPRRKRSEGKATWPGRKQVYRRLDGAGRLAGDLLTLAGSSADRGSPLLAPVMREGRRLSPSPTLETVRSHAAAELSRLPPALREPGPGPGLDVEVAPELRRLAETLDQACLAG